MPFFNKRIFLKDTLKGLGFKITVYFFDLHHFFNFQIRVVFLLTHAHACLFPHIEIPFFFEIASFRHKTKNKRGNDQLDVPQILWILSL